jgi:hypothetical protein
MKKLQRCYHKDDGLLLKTQAEENFPETEKTNFVDFMS